VNKKTNVYHMQMIDCAICDSDMIHSDTEICAQCLAVVFPPTKEKSELYI